VVGFTTGSRGEVPGKRENLRQKMIIIIIIINITVLEKLSSPPLPEQLCGPLGPASVCTGSWSLKLTSKAEV
jgi:hypothetical protein